MISPNIFFLMILLTVFFIRLSVYLVPNKDVLIFGKVIHHMWFGVLFVLFAWLVPTSIPYVTGIILGIGFGLMADQFVYMLLGGGGDDKYWSQSSILGAISMLVLLFLLRTPVLNFFI